MYTHVAGWEREEKLQLRWDWILNIEELKGREKKQIEHREQHKQRRERSPDAPKTLLWLWQQANRRRTKTVAEAVGFDLGILLLVQIEIVGSKIPAASSCKPFRLNSIAKP